MPQLSPSSRQVGTSRYTETADWKFESGFTHARTWMGLLRVDDNFQHGCARGVSSQNRTNNNNKNIIIITIVQTTLA